MRLPKSAHHALPWRIHELRPGLAVEDVWALPTPGRPGDFPRLVEIVTSTDPAKSSSAVVRLLFAVREKVGALLGWEQKRTTDGLPFDVLYELEDEWAAEIDNATVHGVIHLGWVPDGDGGHRGQLAVLVARKGLLGAAYMAAITPFRYLLVYPAMLRELEVEWRSGAGS